VGNSALGDEDHGQQQPVQLLSVSAIHLPDCDGVRRRPHVRVRAASSARNLRYGVRHWVVSPPSVGVPGRVDLLSAETRPHLKCAAGFSLSHAHYHNDSGG